MNRQELVKKINELKVIGFDLMDQLTGHKQTVIKLEKQYNQIVGEIVRLNEELKELVVKNFPIPTPANPIKGIKSIKPKLIKQVKPIKRKGKT